MRPLVSLLLLMTSLLVSARPEGAAGCMGGISAASSEAGGPHGPVDGSLADGGFSATITDVDGLEFTVTLTGSTFRGFLFRFSVMVREK